MARTVFCKKYKEQLQGLDMPPMPGAAGQEIYENVSKQAWQEWMNHQTMLINEKHLNMIDPENRAYLDQQRTKFFEGDDVDQADGYVPPEESV